MSPYRYRAARADGAIVAGVIDASSAGEAAAVLTDRGLFPVGLEVSTDAGGRRRAASRRDLAIVFQSLASLVDAGVPLERAVGASDAVARGALGAVLVDARTALREGKSLSQALATQPGVVPSVVLGMLRAGERGSALPRTLAHVARHLDQEAELVARVRQALAYPLLLAMTGTASLVVIGSVIVPRFAALLGDAGQTLPVATRVLLAGSALVSRGWLAGLTVAAAVAVATQVWWGRPRSHETVHTALLAVPLLGPLRHALATARVGRALGGMLQAGMPLLPALDAAREAAGDVAVGARLGRARERVTTGESLTPALAREAALLPASLQLFAVGEASGRLGEMALRAGDLAAQEAERGLKTLVTLLEPGLIIGFGGLVAFVAAALLQAVYSLRPGGF
jgi:general secretion pathway protein F